MENIIEDEGYGAPSTSLISMQELTRDSGNDGNEQQEQYDAHPKLEFEYTQPQQQQQQQQQLDTIIAADFMSPEPFPHPSSPILIHKNDSLTHDNLHLLDHSLTLTDNGQEDINNTDMNNSSYISFPSTGSRPHSRANSIVSSAILSTATSTTNNIARRRRPRPWDNYNAKSDQGQSQGQAMDGETTPLLQSKHNQQQHPQITKSIHSIKTAKRGNVNSQGQTRKHMNIAIQDSNHNLESPTVEIAKDSPSLQWSAGVFTDHYGSIVDNDNPGNGNRGRGHGKGYHTPSHAQYLQNRLGNKEAPSAPVMTFITIMTVGQFILMALYNIFLHYQSQRLNHEPPYAFWFSAAGRIYNSGIGPNVPTLILFGVYHPILVITAGEWWRMGSGLVCCTSLVEFVLNIFWLRILSEKEVERNINNRGSSSTCIPLGDSSGSCIMGFVFILSGIMGGLAQMIWTNGDDVVTVTGLNGAGIVGCMAAILVNDWNSKSGVRQYKENRGLKTRKGNCFATAFACACEKIGFLHASIASEMICGLFLPYTSMASVIFGVLMGGCAGMFLLKEDYENDADSQASSIASDLEEAFSPCINTPPPYHYEDSPPPPPSSSSKGLDTPIMRRSILTSPEDDDEYEVVHSLNTSGGKGLKQRNRNIGRKEAAYTNIVNPQSESGGDNTYRQKEYFCTEAKLRFVGMMTGLLMISVAMLYIGLALSLPSDQVVSDSLYGCRTMYGIYQYEQDGNNADDGGKPAEGETVCGDVCVPVSIYDRVMKSGDDSVSLLEYGGCSENGYSCNYSNDAFDVGFIEIEQDLFTQGECS
jgi:membrane associated rhomboid family serine protease